MNKNFHFSLEDQKFIDKAIKACQKMGEKTVLLLVGSRAAGFVDSWSDLDLWILGDKSYLSAEERQEYERKGDLFVDRGDFEAHWSFYDINDLIQQLNEWPDEKIWILATSRVLYGSGDTIEEIKKRYSTYPLEIAEKKLKWLFGKYRSLLGPLNMAARNRHVTAFVVTGQVIECLCKICCLAERKPFPYIKWLFEVAKKTHLGTKLYPFINRAVSGIDEFLNPPKEKHFRELVPLKELRATMDIVQSGLKDLGWRCDWIDNPWEAAAEPLRRPMP